MMTQKQVKHQVNCYNVNITQLKESIARKYTKLVMKNSLIEVNPENEILYYQDAIEQLTDGTYTNYIKSVLGGYVEEGNKEAIKIVKLVIEYGFQVKARTKMINLLSI